MCGSLEHDHVEIIVSDEGLRTTPSYVSFTDTEIVVKDPTNAIYAVKRFIGRRFSDPSVKKDINLLPFNVVSSTEDKLKFLVQYQGEKKQFSAEKISSMILTKMKQIAEKYHGSIVKDAVITVPAYFSDSQRMATMEAGIRAGLNVLRLMDEPSAAALAYCFNKIQDYTKPQNVLVFDLGGGTFDVSLVNVCGGHFEVKATAGNTHLGGEDFVNRILIYFVEELKKKHGKDIIGDATALRRLRYACESAKRSLSVVKMAPIHIDYLYPDLTFSSELNRDKFEELNMDLFEECIELTDRCLKDAKVHKSDVNIVVLVGGSSRIPKVQELLEKYFGDKNLHRNINQDEAVAYGAAIQAAKLSGQGSDMINNIVLTDVTPLSLGVDIVGDVMSIVIPRNTPIPTKKVKNFRTTLDNQAAIKHLVYEGERNIASSNNLLGMFVVSGIRPAPRGEGKIEVCFEIDADGILNISATARDSGQTSKLKINSEGSWLRKEAIDNMIKDAKKSKTEDEEHERRHDAWNNLYKYTIKTRRIMTDQELISLISQNERRKIEDGICDAFRWLDLNKDPLASVETSKSKLCKLQGICEPIIAKKKQSD